MVLVAREAPETYVPVNTSLGVQSPAQVHLQALQTLVHRSYIRPIPSEFLWIMSWFLCFIASQVALIRNPLSSVSTFLLVCTLLFMASYLAFDLTGLHVPAVPLFLGSAAAWILVALIKPFRIQAIEEAESASSS
jgi:CHASE2 domain-containing sensor protein